MIITKRYRANKGKLLNIGSKIVARLTLGIGKLSRKLLVTKRKMNRNWDIFMLIKVFRYSDVGGRDIKFKHEITFRKHIVGHRYYKRNSLSRTFGKTKANISKMLDSPSGLEAVIKWNFLGRAGSSGGWETTIVQRYVSNTKFKSYSVNRGSCKILKLRLSARFRSVRRGYEYLLATRINCLCDLTIHIDNTEWRSLYEEWKKTGWKREEKKQ